MSSSIRFFHRKLFMYILLRIRLKIKVKYLELDDFCLFEYQKNITLIFNKNLFLISKKSIHRLKKCCDLREELSKSRTSD